MASQQASYRIARQCTRKHTTGRVSRPFALRLQFYSPTTVYDGLYPRAMQLVPRQCMLNTAGPRAGLPYFRVAPLLSGALFGIAR